jgi:hypothetical protein
LELNAINFNNLTNIKVKSEGVLDVGNIHIEAIIPDAKKRIGLVEYYCRNINPRFPKLVYVKFKDETSYPSLCHNQLQTFLNTSATNQLFLNMTIDTVHLYIDEKKSVFESMENRELLSRLEISLGRKNPQSLSNAIDWPKTYTVYFITDLVLKGDNVGDFKGGAHRVGAAGGFQARLPAGIRETPQTVTAHEFGHWQGLPHTFRKYNGRIQNIPPPFTPLTENTGGTTDNFMDYGVRGKTWVKLQLINKLKGENDK